MSFDEFAAEVTGKNIFVCAKSINMHMKVDEIVDYELIDNTTDNSLVFYPFYTIKDFYFEDVDEGGYAVYRGSKLIFYITEDPT